MTQAKKKASEPRIMVARTSAQIVVDGKNITIRKGVTTAHEGHLITRGREELFEPLIPTFNRQVSA